MGMNLFWKPSAPRSGRDLPRALKYAMEKRFKFGREPVTVTYQDQCSYIQGLVDANVDGSSELLDALCTHGAIDLWIDG